MSKPKKQRYATGREIVERLALVLGLNDVPLVGLKIEADIYSAPKLSITYRPQIEADGEEESEPCD